MNYKWKKSDNDNLRELYVENVLLARYTNDGLVYRIEYILNTEVVQDMVLVDDLGKDVDDYVIWQFEHLWNNSEVLDENATYRPVRNT